MIASILSRMRVLLWLLAAMFACAVTANAATDQRQHYSPISRTAVGLLGKLTLSKSYAAFTKLRGHMELRYAGTIRCKGGDPFGCGDIYAVTNAASFARANRKVRSFCAVRWLGIATLPRAKGSTDPLEIGVSLFDIADYRAYSPDTLGLCSGDTYSQD